MQVTARAIATLFLCAATLTASPALAQFTQLGSKLTPGGASGNPGLGHSAAMSGNGKTAIVGGDSDRGPNNIAASGAAWIYVQNGSSTWAQQAKLYGTGAIEPAQQGTSVAISSDGNTAISGGFRDNAFVGAAWIFTRVGGTWTQQGSKLLAFDESGAAAFGTSVGLSADGNTAIIGSSSGEQFWIFTRSNGAWTQQGNKITATGEIGTGRFGGSVSLSADGNTALIGGPQDNSGQGAVWVFTRSGTTWTQQGSKLVGTGGNFSNQGVAVALSGDGNTAVFGGNASGSGLVWVYTRSGTTWTQQGSALFGSGATAGGAEQGSAVAVSYNGNILIESGITDGSPAHNVGATWVFTRSNGVWTQQGNKLLAQDTTGLAPEQGFSVGLSRNGGTAVIGAPFDNTTVGAAWIFTQPVLNLATATHDFDGDGKSDIAWRLNTGDAADWLMNGTTIAAAANLGSVSFTWSVVGQRDFDGDGKADWLWRDNAGNAAIWFMNGTSVASAAIIGNVSFAWSIVGTGDFDGDGKGDILWRHTDGSVAIWLMNGATIAGSAILGSAPNNWTIAGTGDFDGDGKTDVLWRDTAGDIVIWFMNGTTIASVASVGNVGTNWTIVGTGDFDGDGKADILWRDTSGTVAIWLMNGATLAQGGSLGVVATNWSITQTGDYDGDGKSDILWRDSAGNVAVWYMNGVALGSAASVANVGLDWTIQGMNAD